MTTNENDLADTGEERADAPEDAPPVADATEAVVEETTEVVETAAEEVVTAAEEETLADVIAEDSEAVEAVAFSAAEPSADDRDASAEDASARSATPPRGERPAITAPKEIADLPDDLEELGAKWRLQPPLVDLVLTLDFPEQDSALAASVALKRLTGITFSTSPVVEVEKFDKLIAAARDI